MQIIVWMVLSTAVLGLGHFYVWRRLVKDAELPTGWRRAASIVILGFLLAQPVLFAVSRTLPREVSGPWAFAAFTWMGFLSSIFTLLLVADLVRFAFRFSRRVRGSGRPAQTGPDEPGRRRALGRLLAGGVTLGGGSLTGAGVAEALGEFSVKHIEVRLDRLPQGFDGFRIVQLSDVHVGPTIGGDFIRHMVAVANAQQPDLVAITGDLVDGTVEHLGRHTEPLAELQSRHGTFFVTGNHEYYSGADEWIAELERLGVVVLRNRRVSIARGSDAFDLAGITDHRADRYGDPPRLDRALDGRDATRELVLLAHQPAAIFDAQAAGVGLQLSGHTHGGQFWPWNWVVYLIQPVVKGLARFGSTQIYVNSGTGYWGPPLRVGTESEVTVVTLRAPQAALA